MSPERNSLQPEKRMEHIAKAIEWRLPKNWKFFVIVFPDEGEKLFCHRTNSTPEKVISALSNYTNRPMDGGTPK